MLEFCYQNPDEFDQYARQMFSILAENMSRIAPTGNPYEADFRTWYESTEYAMKNPERHIILLLEGEELAGFFQYALRGDAFRMEEIQLRSSYHGTGRVFRRLYGFVIPQLPENCRFVEASARKENAKSNGILTRLGLRCVGENPNGNSNLYRGMMNDLKTWLGEY